MPHLSNGKGARGNHNTTEVRANKTEVHSNKTEAKGACLLGNATSCPTEKPTLCKNSASVDVCIANATCPDDLTLLDAVNCTCGAKAGSKAGHGPRVLKAGG